MSKFSHLAALKVNGEKTLPYQMGFRTKAEEPFVVLHVLPATEDNPAMRDEMLRQAAEKRRTADTNDLAALLREAPEARRKDAATFAKAIVRRWEHVYDDKGSPVPATMQEIEEFLVMVADNAPDEFDNLRRFCNTLSNFRSAATEATPKG